jgi:hypothetical protein
MKPALELILHKGEFPEPVVITRPEPWLWEVLAKAFLNDPVLDSGFGERPGETKLRNYFEAVIHDALHTGGAVFCSPDRQAVLVWSWLGRSSEVAGEWKQRWFDVLGPVGLKRYYGLYEAGDIPLDPEQCKKSILPDFITMLPEAHGDGYEGYMLRWTHDYFERCGYGTSFIVASTRRHAELSYPLTELHAPRDESPGEGEEAAVFLKDNEPWQ